MRGGGGQLPVVLVPAHDPTVAGWLAKQLVMEQAKWATEQLICSHPKGGRPDHVVEARGDPPSTEGVEEVVSRILAAVVNVFRQP